MKALTFIVLGLLLSFNVSASIDDKKDRGDVLKKMKADIIAELIKGSFPKAKDAIKSSQNVKDLFKKDSKYINDSSLYYIPPKKLDGFDEKSPDDEDEHIASGK